MEFWGVEVKSGQPLKVEKVYGKFLHLSHATLGVFNEDKGNEYVSLCVKVCDQNIVLGTLSVEKYPQLNFDLVFEGDFELSHNWKHGSVFFLGFRNPQSEESDLESDFNDDIPIDMGNVKTKVNPAESPASKANTKAKAKGENSQKDTLNEYSNDTDASGDGLVEPNKKNSGESGTKISVPIADKKADFSTPEMPVRKKEVRVDTPHPSKQILLSPGPSANKGKSKMSADKTIACGSCSRKFGSEDARDNHTKAKHGGN